MGKPHFAAQIPVTADLNELRQHIINELNRLGAIATDQTFYGDVSANHNRLTELADPVGNYDAANLHVVKRLINEAVEHLYAQVHRPNLTKAFNFNDTEFEVVPGGFTIKGVDFTKAFNFDTSMFDNTGDFHVINQGIKTTHIADDAITTPKLVAGAVTTAKLTTNEINLGYGGNGMPVRFRIYDNYNNPIGWIGDDSGNTGYVGAWLKRLLVGGSDPTTAGFFADANGNVVLKSVYVYDNTGTIGWIGNDGTYYGGWFKEFYGGGSGPSSAPLKIDNSGNLTLSDSTIQVTGNNTTVKINTTDGFRIDTTSGDWLQMTDGTLYMQNTGSTLGSTQYAKFEPERIQCINGLFYGSPVGVSIESFNGFGDVHVTDTFGRTSVWMHGDRGQVIFYTSANAQGTAPSTGYSALESNASGYPHWYANGVGWRTFALLEENQSFSGMPTFGGGVYISGHFRTAYTSESIDLSTKTTSGWFAVYDSAGNYLGKCPFFT